MFYTFLRKFISLLFVLLLCMFINTDRSLLNAANSRGQLWKVQSIDTMKFSRDVAREKANETSFDTVINRQVLDIAATGATHIAIGTPYDEEFVPFMARWVKAARANNLNVWFRGNMSGWEKWFNYPTMTASAHTSGVVSFIEKHPELFSDGDIFSSCPECENGALGDPRMKGDVEGYRRFLIAEYNAVKNAFSKIKRSVASNYYSMNGDVARLVMDPDTTRALDGLVVVDHYVKTPDKLVSDISEFARSSGGKVVLGEWGAPIPDINGTMTEERQAAWIKEALTKLAQSPDLVGMNYWVSHGSSTALWNTSGTERRAASELRSFYLPQVVKGLVVDELINPVRGARVYSGKNEIITDEMGSFVLSVFPGSSEFQVSAEGYASQRRELTGLTDTYNITLKKENENIFFKIGKFLRTLFGR